MLHIEEHNRKWWILAAMSGVLGLVVLDETVVGVALASIRPDLRMSAKAARWVVNAYFLTFTCFVAVGGRLADSLGRRGFFVLGVAVAVEAPIDFKCEKDLEWVGVKRTAGSSFRLRMAAFYDLSKNDKFRYVRVYSIYHEDYQMRQ